MQKCCRQIDLVKYLYVQFLDNWAHIIRKISPQKQKTHGKNVRYIGCFGIALAFSNLNGMALR